MSSNTQVPSGAFRHPSSTTAQTESPAFARERHEPIVAALVAAKAGESGGQAPTRQELPKLPLHEPWQGPRRPAAPPPVRGTSRNVPARFGVALAAPDIAVRTSS